MASDSRTHAGVDQMSTYSKMHRLIDDPTREMTILSAGNLATSQAVVRQIRRDLTEDGEPNLKTVAHLSEAAEYIGRINVTEIGKHRKQKPKDFSPDATFILGGQIAGHPPQIYLVYPEGNYIRAAARSPYLQIGELKYGKPILDRIVTHDLALAEAVKCALVSMDSTMRSNATVGPPIELLVCETGRIGRSRHIPFDEDDDYLRELRIAWQASLKQAFEALPPVPGVKARIRLVDSADD